MNRRGHASLKMWLMGAAGIAVPTALGMFGPHGAAFADGKLSSGASAKKPAAKVSPAVASEPPRLLPVPDTSAPVIQTVSDSRPLVAAGSGQKSEVMKQLELLYEKDGREMPDLPPIQPVPAGGTPTASPANTGSGAASGPSTPAGAPSPKTQGFTPKSGPSNPVTTAAKPNSPATSPPSKNPVTSFFKKLIPGNKEPKPTAAGPNYQPNVAPSPPNASTGSVRSQEYQPAQIRTGQAPASPTSATNPTGQRPASQGAAAPSLSQQPDLSNGGAAPALSTVPIPPAVSQGGLPPSPNADFGAELAAPNNALPAALPPLLTQPQSALPEPPAIIPGDEERPLPKPTGNNNLESTFTEMTEDEADGGAGPFTGLILDEETTRPAESAKGPTSAAPPEAVTPDDPFADELRKLGILPSLEQKPTADEDAPKLTLPTLALPALEGIEDEATREKMLKIRERGGMKGLKGFCPVTLHDERELVDAKPEFHATHRGQKFHFASADAKSKFEADPTLYAPAAYGADVVALTRDKDVVEGSLDQAAWFKGRLYLFGSQDAHDAFVADPVQYATPAGIE